MHKQIIHVQASWDPEAKVWVASSDDVPGLITEANTTAALEERLKSMIPELLLENGVIDKHQDFIPFHLHTERNKEIIAPCC